MFDSGRRGWRGEWMRGLDFTNPVGTGGGVGHVSVFGLRWCRRGVGRGLGPGSGGVGLCYVCVSLCRCVDGRSRHLYIVLGGYLGILGAPRVQSCCTLWISASYSVFVYGRYRKSRLVCVWVSDMDLY